MTTRSSPSPPGGVYRTNGAYPPSLQPLQGYFLGKAAIGNDNYYTEALITADGLVRIHVSGWSANTYEIRGGAQFVGHIVADARRASGTGLIVGLGCALPSGRFCAETAFAEISMTLAAEAGQLSGEIEVATSGGDETWPFNLTWPLLDGYLVPATLAYMEDLYEEAGSALGGGTVMSVDAAGRLFFQSPASGCVGNGTLAPYLDGAFNVYDVTFTLAVCNGAYAYLNGELAGIATRALHCPDDDCDLLVIYLTPAEGAASRTAVTLWWYRR